MTHTAAPSLFAPSKAVHEGWTLPEGVRALAKPVEFPRQTNLYLPGEAPTEIFIVLEGFVKAGSYAQSGAEIVYDIIGPQEFCGNLRYLGGDRFQEFARSLTDVRALGLDLKSFKACFRTQPRVHDWFVKLMVSRWARAEERLFRNSALHPLQRLQTLIDELTLQNLDVDRTLSQSDLAQLTGLSRQTVARLLRRPTPR